MNNVSLPEPMNQNGLTFSEFLNASYPAEEMNHGYIRTKTRLTHVMDHTRDYPSALPSSVKKYVYGSKTRWPRDVLRRAWQKNEDPTDWKAWAEKQIKKNK